eukprot:CAMPEP_0179432544 /NCGR_PEP_ID=MMETSP0799-20121207/17136_1 /TAXON_ID=46947 /ORGANISM="Geminigera cryophila, Strain CCMP2564" /LENGTH=82 /DNA_ID=CAMNT_0021209985 /DNA_START=603 /DNA_END=851 /DNA_ORIENTATION=-
MALPANWEQRMDEKSGKIYYLNHVTLTTSWAPPPHPNIPQTQTQTETQTQTQTQTQNAPPSLGPPAPVPARRFSMFGRRSGK